MGGFLEGFLTGGSLLFAGDGKRDNSQNVNQDNTPKVMVMVSSDKRDFQQGRPAETGLSFYTPSVTSGSGILCFCTTSHKIELCTVIFIFHP